MSPIEEWRQRFFSSPAGTGLAGNQFDWDTDGADNLLEFAFGTDPTSPGSGLQELTFSGSFAAGGVVGLRGQPIQRVEPIPNSVDLRYIFIRRKDHAAAGLTYTPQFSTDLATWVPTTAVPEVLADDGVWQAVSVPYTRFIAGRRARFVRLVVSMP
jgi:hypothetical protein